MLVESGQDQQVVPFKLLPQRPLPILRATDLPGVVWSNEVVTAVLPTRHVAGDRRKHLRHAHEPARDRLDSTTPQQSQFLSVGRAAEGKRVRGLVERLCRKQVSQFAEGQVARPPRVDRSCVWIRMGRARTTKIRHQKPCESGAMRRLEPLAPFAHW